MEVWGWSKGHRLEHQAEERKRLVKESLKLLQLTEEQYKDLERSDHFLAITGIALERGISWYQAEIVFYDGRREEQQRFLREQLNVNSWQGDGTGVYTENKRPDFDDDVTFWFLFGGKAKRRK